LADLAPTRTGIARKAETYDPRQENDGDNWMQFIGILLVRIPPKGQNF
jgi:hypothetical protein